MRRSGERSRSPPAGRLGTASEKLDCAPCAQFRMWPSGGHCLLLKQVLERRPSIGGTQSGRCRSLFLARHADFEQRAVVARIFFCDSFLDRLHAFKPAAGIEIHTLLAGMQFKPALGTLCLRRHALQDRSALHAARYCSRARQIDWLRPQRVVPTRRSALAFWRCFSRLLATRFSVAILITRLTVFRHKSSRTCPYSEPIRGRRQVLCSWPHNREALPRIPRIFTDS